MVLNYNDINLFGTGDMLCPIPTRMGHLTHKALKLTNEMRYSNKIPI